MQVRLPLLSVTTAAWVFLALGPKRHELAAFCSPDVWGAVSLDRLAFELTLYSPAALAGGWVIMIAAMMTPTLMEPLLHVMARSLPRNRVLVTLAFLVGFAIIWSLAAIPIMAIVISIKAIMPTAGLAFGLAVLIALAWQCSPLKQASLNRCHRRPALAAGGTKALVSAIRYGTTAGRSCCGTCWAAMLIPLSSENAHLPAMAIVGVFLFAERFEKAERPAWRWQWPAQSVRLMLARVRPLSLAAIRL